MAKRIPSFHQEEFEENYKQIMQEINFAVQHEIFPVENSILMVRFDLMKQNEELHY